MAHRIVMPSFGMYTVEGKLAQWLCPAGARVQAGEPVVEIETEKAIQEIAAPADGILHPVAQAGDSLQVEGLIGYVLAEGEEVPEGDFTPHGAAAATAKAVLRVPSAAAAAIEANHIHATPIARRLAAEHSIDLARITGSGPAGRIVEADIRAVIENADAPAPVEGSEHVIPQPVGVGGGQHPGAERSSGQAVKPPLPVRWERLPLKKRTEAAHLSWALQNTIPCAVSTTCTTRGLKSVLASKTNGQVSPIAVFVFETARLLRKYAVFNAISLGDEVGYYETVDIGVAMDDGTGLMVPVIRHADCKNLFEIAEEIRELTVTFVEGKLTPEQLAPGTFTISDLSGYDVSQFQPMINRHQSAILGVGAEQFLPGQELGWFTMTLTFDHSVSEGRTAALFLSELREHLIAYEQAAADSVSGVDAHCARCLRTAAQLSQLHHGYVLVRSEVPKGMICSLCLAGY